jgi:CheY-like chemotaxis protein
VSTLAREQAARILLVEDDYAIRETLADVLEGEGFQVSCASNGAEAMDRLAAERVPALIVLDLMMPVMDGWAFRTAQQRDPLLAQIPVVVLSAGHDREDRAVSALEVDAFLPKPFDLERFVETIHRLC